MAGLIQQLISNLSEQACYYEKLVELSHNKKALIVKNDVTQLQALTSDENILVGKLQKADKIREDLMNDISYVLNIKDERLTLTVLLEKIKDQHEAKPLNELRDKLAAFTKELSIINNQNKMLIDNSLEYISYSINVLQSTLSGETSFYDFRGKEINTDSRSFFDAKQ